MRKKDDLFKTDEKPIQIGKFLVLRTFFDLKLASIYYSIKDQLTSAEGKVLEVGCGNQPYRALLKKADYSAIDHAVAKECWRVLKPAQS